MPHAEGDNSDSCDRIKTDLIPSAELKQILTSALDIFSDDAVYAILNEMRKDGMDLDNPSGPYSLEQLEQQLKKMFGQDSADWIMERVRNERKLKY